MHVCIFASQELWKRRLDGKLLGSDDDKHAKQSYFIDRIYIFLNHTNVHESLTLIKSQFNRNLNLAKFTLTEVTDAFSLSLSPFYGSEKPPSDPFIVEMKHWHRLHTCPFLTAKTFVLAAPRVKKNIYYHCTQLKGSMHNTIEIV